MSNGEGYRRDRSSDRPGPRRRDNAPIWVAIGLGALAGVAGVALYQRQTRNRVGHRPPDSAPAYTARQARFGDYAVAGRTVTIGKPRAEIYAFWRDFSNLPAFMENVRSVAVNGDLTRWTIAGPMGRDFNVETRIVQDRPDEEIAWRSTEASQIDTEGKVTFREAPAGRGTEVEAFVAYVPPAGEIGRWIAKMFQAEPQIQGRRELKRLKMLLETGEIATNANRKSDA